MWKSYDDCKACLDFCCCCFLFSYKSKAWLSEKCASVECTIAYYNLPEVSGLWVWQPPVTFGNFQLKWMKTQVVETFSFSFLLLFVSSDVLKGHWCIHLILVCPCVFAESDFGSQSFPLQSTYVISLYLSAVLYKVSKFACGVIFTLFDWRNVHNGPIKEIIKWYNALKRTQSGSAVGFWNMRLSSWVVLLFLFQMLKGGKNPTSVMMTDLCDAILIS